MLSINITTLGCPKNQVDSEFMSGLISENINYRIEKNAQKADIIIINTCGFIEDAREESVDTILQAGQYKKEGQCSHLIVTGCLTQRYKEEIYDLIPEIDAVLGAGQYEKIAEVIESVVHNERLNLVGDPSFSYTSNQPRRLQEAHYAYVKIAEGCNNRCSYCVIPDIRGPVVSRSVEDIVQEVKNLAANNVREIIIVAQDITQYGIDLYGEPALVELLGKLNTVEDIEWIRLLYSYPERISQELIDIIRDSDKICSYLDLPIQHSSTAIRKRMNRRGTTGQILNLIKKLREEISDIVLRTSLIVGFPGESEDDFQNLYDFVKKARFDRLGVFKYSREEGTPAAEMKNQIQEDKKEERLNRIMDLQREISLSKNQKRLGQKLEVLIDEVNDDYSAGRTRYDAPEIDNQIIINDNSPQVGEMLMCKIVEAYEYDLIGERLK